MPPEPASAPDEHAVKLVVVTGSGRSGTSTVAGALKMLGSYVPQPEISPNDANPRGYFEPKWAVAYHKKVLAEAGVRTLDGRPVATDLMRPVTGREDLLRELRDWFSTQMQGSQVVVKDPRIVWLRDMWSSVASDLGANTVWLTMLRHPAEVVGSRDRHYLAAADDVRRLARETANLAGWVNVGLANERSSRGDRRAFVHYSDLIGDWRSTMSALSDRLGLTYDVGLTDGRHHQVDDFIDVGLRRVQVTLDDLDVPATLRRIAERVWTGLDALSRDPDDAEAARTLDLMRTEYDQLFVHSTALVQDVTDFAVLETRRQTQRKVTRRLTREFERRLAVVQPRRPTLRRAAGKARSIVRKGRG